MAISKFNLLNPLSNKEIAEAISEAQKELFSLRFKKATRQAFKANKIKLTKQRIYYHEILNVLRDF